MSEAPPIVNPAPSQKRVLRKLFLTLFLRGRGARGLRKDRTPKTVGERLILTLLFYTLFGVVILSLRHQPVFAISICVHAMTFAFVAMFVASSSGEVLFNKEEPDILLHRPVAARELLWAKVRVMVEVSLWLAIAFNLVSFYLGWESAGWLFPVAHSISIVLEALFCTGCVVLAYQLCLKWFGREKLDGLMTLAQVILTILAVMCSQLLPQLMFSRGRQFRPTAEAWWAGFFPPAWFAAFDDAVAGSQAAIAWGLAGVGVAATALVLWLAFGKLVKSYETGLQTLAEAPVFRKRVAGRRWVEKLVDAPPLRWWLKTPVERAAFLLSGAYLFRDRDVKLRVFPAMAPMLMVPVLLMLQGGGRSGNVNFAIAFAGGYLGLAPLLGVSMMQYSQNWLATDIFRVAPMIGPGPLCHGTRRAVMVFLTIPLAVGFAVIVWLLHKHPSQLLLPLPGVLLLPLYSLLPHLGGKAVPLSSPPEESKSASRGLSMVAAMFVGMGLSALSMFALSQGWYWWLLTGEALLVVGLYAALRSNISHARWRSME